MILEVITLAGVALTRTKVDRITVPGGSGSFTLLRGHAPIISTLKPGKVTYSIGGHETGFDVEEGIIHVKDNLVKIIGTCANLS